MSFTEPGARVRAALRCGAAALALSAAAAGCAGGVDTGATAADDRYVSGDGSSTLFTPDERQDAPVIEGETLDGEAVSLADYSGSVVVLNFWASWCAPCRAETPVLEEVHAEHQDAGVEFLGVNIKDNRTAAQAFERNQEVGYPSLYDQPGEVPQAFRDTVPPQAIPSTLVIDRQGRVAARVIGATDYDELTGLVEPVAAEDPGSP
ncbi:TlpA family protein disulfide reductase [Actinorugispora endophytica]|uniref:Thiol-disulfide isomerase/thioredoxin n=1 Tax=Actinorugispora endophytica TaxID=1605990 RepID=A0A4R6V3X8_9ACTN|nr:TlpA disulfide reductase family protein [Actinorugispora endophytica]TDQ54883.1 thiol-disulfide isomerase/thioredoxin [Actinorugispora endophytica]